MSGTIQPKVNKSFLCGKECTLHETCNHPYMEMEGSPGAEVLCVGEGPGADEDAQGRPFVGRAGSLLRDALARNNVISVAFTNAVSCRPPNNRTPTTKEIKACAANLKQDIESLPNLKLIVPLGNVAMKACLRTQGISKYNGKLIEFEGRRYMPILHPAYVLRNQNELDSFEDAISRIPNAVSGSLTDPSDFGVYEVIDTMEKWKALVRRIREKREFVYDIETNTLDPHNGDPQIRCIGFSVEPRIASTLPLDEEVWTREQWEEIYKDLTVIFSSHKIGKTGHNVKWDNLFVEKVLGIKVNGLVWDTKYSQFLLNENESNSLKDMTWRHTKLGGFERILGCEPQEAEKDALYPYCATDADICHRISIIHRDKISKDRDLYFLFVNLMLPVTDVLVGMELRGIKIDPDRLAECEKNVDTVMNSLLRRMIAMPAVREFEKATGKEFNPNSHVQLREILFKYEGLEPTILTDITHNPSTSREVLTELSSQSELCSLLANYSLYSAMKSKTIKNLKEHIDKENRVHTTYMLTTAKTGRSSSKDINLQNITKGAKDVVGIRRCFVADPGYVLAEFDYNSHEVRVMANESEDKDLLNAILSSDVHRATAAHVLNIPEEEVTEDQRRNIGKAMVFGVMYGISPYGIMKRLKCDQVQAQLYINRFFDTYPKVRQWVEMVKLFVERNGYIRSRTGRYRRFPTWDKLDEKQVKEALNFPIQSLASDILLYSLIGIDRFLRDKKSYLTLEVHDSVVLNVHESELWILKEIKDIMLTYFKKYIDFSVPLDVDIKIGPDWGSLEKYEDY